MKVKKTEDSVIVLCHYEAIKPHNMCLYLSLHLTTIDHNASSLQRTLNNWYSGSSGNHESRTPIQEMQCNFAFETNTNH